VRKSKFSKLISRSRSIPEAQRYMDFALDDRQALVESAKTILSEVPPTFGACAMLSAMWAVYLNDNYNIPAQAVAGDLKIGRATIFKCKKNLPEPTMNEHFISNIWDGHCWIEVDGFIGDLSIFRTAYSIQEPSVLKNFILNHFGSGRGFFLANRDQLPIGMKYIPKYVLNDRQITGLLGGLEVLIGN